MTSYNDVFEYRDLTAEEVTIISQCYTGIPPKFVRMGPKGYILIDSYREMAADIFNMELREGDVFVASYQRSGTTWTQELVWLVANDFDYEKAAAVSLIDRYSFLERAMFFDDRTKAIAIEQLGDNEKTRKMLEVMSTPEVQLLSGMQSPRYFKTHLPMSLLSSKILDTAKMVYVARDPRDVAVSCFHHARLFKLNDFNGNFRQTWNAFVKDLFIETPYFEHVKEAWALRDHPNMLFLFYEDLSKDLPGSIRRVAEFFGKDLSEEQTTRLCQHLNIDNFKNNISVNYEDLREQGVLDRRETFIRKGKAGGWREYFDDEMEQEARRWIKKNLQDTDLRFPSMDG